MAKRKQTPQLKSLTERIGEAFKHIADANEYPLEEFSADGESQLLVQAAEHVFELYGNLFCEEIEERRARPRPKELRGMEIGGTVVNVTRIAASKINLRYPAVAAGFLVGFELGRFPHVVLDKLASETEGYKKETASFNGRAGARKRQLMAQENEKAIESLTAKGVHAKEIADQLPHKRDVSTVYKARKNLNKPPLRDT